MARFPRWRPIIWALLILNVVFFAAFLVNATTKECFTETSIRGGAIVGVGGCRGPAIPVGILVGWWAAAHVLLALVWLVTRLGRTSAHPA